MLPTEFNSSACSSTLPTEVPAKHLLPHATYIGYQPSTNISNRVCKLIELQVTAGGNGQWHAEGKKILGRRAKKNLHLFSCLGVLISLIDKHCAIYTTETWHLWSKNVTCKRKTLQRTFSPNRYNEWAITTVN